MSSLKLSQNLTLRYVRARLNILSLVSTRKAAKKAFRYFCTPQQRVDKKGSPLFEGGEALSFKQDKHTLRGHRWQPAGEAQKRALIAHGFNSASCNFESYVAALLKKGYEVIAFDAPAHGQSGSKRITLPDYVRMLRTVDQNYGPFQTYMGHSLGAIALTLLLENTPHNAETRLALIAPPVEVTDAVADFARLLQLSPEVVKEMDDLIQEISGHPFSWYSLLRALPHVHASILYVQDEGDRVTPLQGALRVQELRLPNVQFLFTQGLGHRKVYKDQPVMEKIVNFL
ncbi:MAG: alpha/beta fold hydrolase [Bacteroidetes bacterium]|nr:alpha/beta fold hydrolase [Bacteroidota bacterium]